MRPVKRALKMLESPEENMSERDQVVQTRQVLFSFSWYCFLSLFFTVSR